LFLVNWVSTSATERREALFAEEGAPPMWSTRAWVVALALGIAACGGNGGGAGGAGSQPAPTIATQPEARVVPVGEPATFSVVAHGSGLTYTWFRDGVAVPGASSASYTTPPTSTLDDGAVFTVVVSNAAGSATSAAAKLRVEGFAPAATMKAARERHAAVRLADGRVLLCGGFGGTILSSAELYDPATGQFAWTGPLMAARQDHTATLLASGKVLVVGGEGGVGGGVPLATAELYDPATGLFSPAGPLHAARSLHTATVLADGRVLVAGGVAGRTALASAEVYDPATNAFTSTAGDLGAARYWHAAALLGDGTVLVAGGYGTTGGALASADVFDPATGRFAPTGPMKAARYGHSATALPGGQVLVAGGYGGGYLRSAELYDPAAPSTTEAFAETGPLSAARYAHVATALPGGKVLVAGGLGASGPLATAELFDPGTALFAGAGALSVARYLDTATLLASGEVLVAGGWSLSDAGLPSADLYSGAP
jgi:hypothetical protein